MILSGMNILDWFFQKFHAYVNYGGLTHVTRLKVAPNMADPISLNENLWVAT